jgi:hypothetical protein
MDWRTWHEAYEDPESGLGQRLLLVQDHARAALDRMPPGGAVRAYAHDVRSRRFPSDEQCYAMPPEELELFLASLCRTEP